MARFTIFKKILIISLLLSLLPLLISSSVLLFNLQATSHHLSAEIAATDDMQASESLQMRARQVAENVADFLHQSESDLQFLSRSRLDRAALMNFYDSRRSETWQRRRLGSLVRETRELIPIYSSIAIIDKNGQEQLVIRDGRYLGPGELHDVSDPRQTEFRNEDYFRRIRELKRGGIYVSHVTGFHVSKQAQLAGAPDPETAIDGAIYRGVIRFGAPLFERNGRFSGMMVLSLDHRHLMEFTQHIDPGRGFSTVFPSYQSGNYAFLFDDEGWIITHPKFWDIRGVDRNGRLVPPYSAQSTKADIETGRIPYNLDYAGFIHPSYPKVSSDVRLKKAGYVDITNVGGAKKIMAYAPIFYDTGDYRKHGVFGGVTIGFQVDQFHEAARKGSRLIDNELGRFRTTSGVIILVSALLTALSAWALSRGISDPLRRLTEGAHRLAAGDSHERVAVTSNDEVGELAATFNLMADELEQRKQSLLATLDKLRTSREEILEERNFKTSILESISSSIVTFSPEGYLTSMNATGRIFFGREIPLDTHFSEVFDGWGNLAHRMAVALATRSGYGREPLVLDRGAGWSYFEVGIFPIGPEGAQGVTVTMRNETEREKLREETIRLDRFASLGKLSAGIAHEVRNPLTGILLLLDDLHDRAQAGSSDQQMLKKALVEIERVERLVNALLNYSSPPRADLREGDLNLVLNDTLLLMRRQCEKQKVVLTVEEGPVPTFRFDPEKIKQALINIIRNAQEALTDGGEIRVSTRIESGEVAIRISDNGPGIAPQDLPLIFEPFFTRKGVGTGLGLSITQRIVEEHHGNIEVESMAGEGTTFTIHLPLEEGTAT